ncbi:restriction endonuclease subunit S [Pseudomonas shahriarae]|uniref:restriction endonuclease subunit S n=1 Tax=Pseudomonas shahriarae TaxID=2745512 RepID=UPI00235F5FE9|nr:restriction endonuclease subunit S [Pseudomonas shahriarae]MDD1133900.1 restriction endonuclease subunit S [Pseudomonas shahriarae]
MTSENDDKQKTKTGGRPASTGVIEGRYALSVGMPSNQKPIEGWEWTLLSSVARLESGHTPSRKYPEYWGGDIPWVGIRDATGNHGLTINKTLQYTNALGIENSSARILPKNTVCLSRTASVGYVVVMGCPMATSQDFVNWICSAKLDYRYLKYILCSEHDSMLRFASGTTHQTIYFPEAKAFHVLLPSIQEQRRIADVLQSLDDRIALIHETNATLEAIARSVFKSWFVDYDPVRNKAEGCRPEGMDDTIAALFPNCFQESDLGLIPKGWLIGELQDLLVLQRGFDLPASERIVGDYPLIAASGPTGTHHVAMAKGPGVVTGRSGVLGKVFLTLEDYWPLNTTLWVKKFKRASPCFAYELLRLLDFSSFNAGSAVPTLNRNHIHGLKYVLPPLELVQAYEHMARAIHLRILENNRQAQTLTQLRDNLLPRLISGQLRMAGTANDDILSEAI